MFRVAKMLLQNDSVVEEELIPTLVFARIVALSEDSCGEDNERSSFRQAEEAVLDGSHPALEISRRVGQVPVVKVKPIALSAERHPGTQVLRAVRIRTLSWRAKSPDVAEGYERLLELEGARWDENNHGNFSYDCLLGYLELVVAEGTELSPDTAEGLGEDRFRQSSLHFPPPKAVEGVHEALKKTFVHRLDLYGERAKRPTPEKYVPAFAAWHVGGGADAEVPRNARHRVKTMLNRHLLEPCKLTQLWEDAWNSEETLWRDVERSWWRFISIQ